MFSMNNSSSNNLVSHVKNYMQNEEKDIVDLTCKLITAKTENPPGDEILAVRIVEDFFQSLQIPYIIFEKTKNRANIVGYIGGRGGTPLPPSFLLSFCLLFDFLLVVGSGGKEKKKNALEEGKKRAPGRVFFSPMPSPPGLQHKNH